VGQFLPAHVRRLVLKGGTSTWHHGLVRPHLVPQLCWVERGGRGGWVSGALLGPEGPGFSSCGRESAGWVSEPLGLGFTWFTYRRVLACEDAGLVWVAWGGVSGCLLRTAQWTRTSL
jgi:hypothetical protein